MPNTIWVTSNSDSDSKEINSKDGSLGGHVKVLTFHLDEKNLSEIKKKEKKRINFLID